VPPRGIEKYEPWFDSASEYLGRPQIRNLGVISILWDLEQMYYCPVPSAARN